MKLETLFNFLVKRKWCELMVVGNSGSVCEPLSTFFLFPYIYGAFSTCVSYLCICRLTFQSQSPQRECLDVVLTEIL